MIQSVTKIVILFFILVCNVQALTVTGDITYVKKSPPRDDDGPYKTTIAAVKEVVVEALSDGTVLATSSTDSTGKYSLNFSLNGSYKIKVYAKRSISGSQEGVEIWKCQSDFTDGDSKVGTDPYAYTTSSIASGTTSMDISIPVDESKYFNVYMSALKAHQWLETNGLTMGRTTELLFPSEIWSFFEFESKMISVYEDHGYDEDVILHEFGHSFMDVYTLDDSQGGPHYLEGHYDLRLTWSEGLATYLSCSIRNDKTMVSTGGISGTIVFISAFDLEDIPEEAFGADNEMTVSGLLWKARGTFNGEANVMSVLAAMKSLPAELSGEEGSLDLFHYLWTGDSLATHYANLGLSYKEDDISTYSKTTPYALNISSGKFTSPDYSFFAKDDVDYFIVDGVTGSDYNFYTSDTSNGALTKIEVYKKGSSTALMSDSPASSDSRLTTTANVIFPTSTGTQYIVEVSRFNDPTANYGLAGELLDIDETYAYKRTVGFYGNYKLNVEVKGTAPAAPTVTTTTPPPAVTTTSTSLSTRSGRSARSTSSSSGGCFLFAP